MTNCKNCGAPLNGYICDYCGTRYGTTQEVGHMPKMYRLEDPQKTEGRYRLIKDDDGKYYAIKEEEDE